MKADLVPFLSLLNQKVLYVVPRWQRRYRWGESEITRLVEDLLAVGETENDHAGHYGGSLLTHQPGQPVCILPTVRVVDGQQRLTTVSILLSCIADGLEESGGSTVWLEKPWAVEDDEDWPPAADWIKDQFERLRTIVTDLEHGAERA